MDKVLTRYTKGRLMAAVVMMALVAIVALPAFAYADAPFSGEYPAPAATVVVKPAVIVVDVAAVLNAPTAKITIGGTAYPTFVNQAGTSLGSWTKTETLQPNGSYKVMWSWTGGTNANATMYCYPPSSALANGSKAVVATVRDSAGAAKTDSWAFTVAVPDVPPVTPPSATNANINAGCVACHPTRHSGNNYGTDCVGCHYNGFPAHGVTFVVGHAVVQAAIAANSAGCVSCHGSALTAVLPANWDGAGAPSEHKGCLCHAYHEAEGKLACEDCHAKPMDPAATYPYHVGAHATLEAGISGTTSSACVSCHGTDLLDIGAGPHTVGEHKSCSCHAYGEATPANTECADCHDDAYAPHGFVDGLSHTGGGWTAASGHNTTAYGKRGAYESFDGVNGPALGWEVEGLVYQGVSYPATQSATTLALPASVNMYAFENRNTWGVWTFPKGAGTYTVGETGTGIAAPWKFPTAQVFWASDDANKPADAMTGLTKDSVITCQDCHTNLSAAGPHGAGDNFGLDTDYPGEYALAELTKYVTNNLGYASGTYAGKPDYNPPYKFLVLKPGAADTSADPADWLFPTDPAAATSKYFTPLSASGIAVRPAPNGNGVGKYDALDIRARTSGTTGSTAVICAKCHDLENEVANGDGRTGVVGSNTGHNSHHQDATDGSAQCVSCHIGVPHGWKRPRLLVNTNVDVAPYFSDKASGVARFNNLPDNSGYLWNGSAWVGGASNTADSAFTRIGMQSLSAIDSHIPVSENPAAYGVTDLTTVNTDDMVAWAEPDCEACNDHGGEGEIRIIDAE